MKRASAWMSWAAVLGIPPLGGCVSCYGILLLDSLSVDLETSSLPDGPYEVSLACGDEREWSSYPLPFHAEEVDGWLVVPEASDDNGIQLVMGGFWREDLPDTVELEMAWHHDDVWRASLPVAWQLRVEGRGPCGQDAWHGTASATPWPFVAGQ